MFYSMWRMWKNISHTFSFRVVQFYFIFYTEVGIDEMEWNPFFIVKVQSNSVMFVVFRKEGEKTDIVSVNNVM